MALEQITMPKLGESVTEGTITKWFVSVGDVINKYDPLAEVMTDKVNAEVPSSFSGIVKEIIAQEGEVLPVGQIICVLEIEGVEEAKEILIETTVEDTSIVENHSAKHRYSPAVLKLAGEHNVSLEALTGTGLNGRITRKDILTSIELGKMPTARQVQKVQTVTPTTTKSSPEAIPTSVGDIEIPVTGVRKAIAVNMLRSKHEVPHAWMMIECDVTNLVNYRNSLKGEFERKEGFNLTFFAFFVKAIAQALKEFPQMNAMWAGDKIIQKKDINLSIAVATDDSLFVPVIRHADEKSIKGIAREVTDLAHKVRSGKLTAEEMQGGTFTVNNTGSFGSIQSMGIINHPQAAILQVESIVKRPVVVGDNAIAIRDMVNLCLSLDHRVLDGYICGKFLGRVKEILENVSKETTSIY